VGLAALITYIMACRPAFSPDGSKVLFPYVDADAGTRAIGLFDRGDGTSRCLLSAVGRRTGYSASLMTAGWTADGKSALVFLAEEQGGEHVRVLLVPLDRNAPLRTYFVPDVKKATASLVIPPPVIGRHVFLGGKSLVRLDLTTGDIERAAFDAEISPIRQGNRIFYVGERRRPGADFDVGTLDPETLAPTPLLELKKEETGEIMPFIAVSEDGTRIAMAGRDGQNGRILIFEGKKLERFLSPETKTGASTIGNIEMAADGRTVYASFFREVASESSLQFGVLEASVAGDAAREIPLFQVRVDKGKMDQGSPVFQVALSPDGTTLAATSGLFPMETSEGRALYLVDLKDAGRKVTRIPIPEPRTTPGKPARR